MATSTLRRDSEAPRIDKSVLKDLLTDDDETPGGGRIRCPRCGWTPRAEDRWMCLCGCVWNTFDTRGRCPECRRRWRETQCLACGAWSRHDDWYAEEPAA